MEVFLSCNYSKKIVIGATLLGFTALMYSSEGPGAFPIKDNQGTVFQISPEDVKLLMLCKTIQKMNQSIIVSTTQDVVKCDPSRESCLSYAAYTIQQLIGSMQQDVSNSTMSSTANIQQFISLLRILSTMINLEETSIKELEPLMKELGQKITIKNPIALFEIANYLEAPNAALCIIAQLAYPCLPSLSQCSDKEKRLYQEIIPLLSYYPTFTELIAEKGMKFLESEECLKHTRVSIGGINST